MKYILIILTLLVSSTAISQNLKLKDGDIIFRSKKVLKYEIVDPTHYLIKDAMGKDMVKMEFHDNNTPKKSKDDFFILTFMEHDTVLESDKMDYVTQRRGKNPENNLKRLTQWLVMNNVLTRKGEIHPDKLEKFTKKYDEDIVPKKPK